MKAVISNTVEWPTGSYAFTGNPAILDCPAGFARGCIEYPFNFCYCTKTSETNTDSTAEWPPGRYCIHRAGGSCPSNFQEGTGKYFATHLDKFDTSGVLPDGLIVKESHIPCLFGFIIAVAVMVT